MAAKVCMPLEPVDQRTFLTDAFPYWRFVATRDDQTSEEHLANHDVVRRHDDPWWEGNFPRGCRCWVMQLNKRMVERRGLSITPLGS